MPAGLLAVAFGPAYTYMLLRVVYGQQWSETEAPRALAVYCLYILLLAVNGILEAFVHAVADSRCACYFLLYLYSTLMALCMQVQFQMCCLYILLLAVNGFYEVYEVSD